MPISVTRPPGAPTRGLTARAGAAASAAGRSQPAGQSRCLRLRPCPAVRASMRAVAHATRRRSAQIIVDPVAPRGHWALRAAVSVSVGSAPFGVGTKVDDDARGCSGRPRCGELGVDGFCQVEPGSDDPPVFAADPKLNAGQPLSQHTAEGC